MNSGKKKRASISPQVFSGGDIPGLLAREGGVSFSTHNLPSSDHFFTASDFMVASDAENLYILFGQTSHFAKADEKEFRLAIEIVFSRAHARDCFYTTIFEIPALNLDIPFINSLEATYNKYAQTTTYSYGKGLAIPKDPSSFRKFSSNFATATTSSGQGLLEFFEASPDLLLNLTSGRQRRPNMGIKSVVSVLAPTTLLYALFMEMAKFLKGDEDEKNI